MIITIKIKTKKKNNNTRLCARLYNYFYFIHNDTRFQYAHDTIIIFTRNAHASNHKLQIAHRSTERPRKTHSNGSHIEQELNRKQQESAATKKSQFFFVHIYGSIHMCNIEFTFFVVAFLPALQNCDVCRFIFFSYVTVCFLNFSFCRCFALFFSGGLFPWSIIQIVSGMFSLNLPDLSDWLNCGSAFCLSRQLTLAYFFPFALPFAFVIQ